MAITFGRRAPAIATHARRLVATVDSPTSLLWQRSSLMGWRAPHVSDEAASFGSKIRCLHSATGFIAFAKQSDSAMPTTAREEEAETYVRTRCERGFFAGTALSFLSTAAILCWRSQRSRQTSLSSHRAKFPSLPSSIDRRFQASRPRS